MSQAEIELATSLVPAGQQDRTRRGTAAAASSGGTVLAMIGGRTWSCTDLPNRPAAEGDTLIIRETVNGREVLRNITREKNPPLAPANTAINTTVSYGQYAWTDGSQMGTFVNELATISRAQAADINQLRADVRALQTELAALKTALKTAGIVI